MDGESGLIWTWDPRSQEWLKERGPADAASPFVAPIDDETVQTYFLDVHNGRWTPTVLGLRARQISFELGATYRSPLMTGLAFGETSRRRTRKPATHGRFTLTAGVALLLVLGGAGIVAGQTFFGPSEPASAAPETITARHASASATAAAASADSSQPTTSASAQATAIGPAATAAPASVSTPRPANTVQLSTQLPDGTQVFASAPASAPQGSSFRVVVSVVYPGGRPGTGSVLLYFGSPGGPITSVSARLDVNGNAAMNVSSDVPKGDQPLRVVYGSPGAFTLGTIAVR